MIPMLAQHLRTAALFLLAAAILACACLLRAAAPLATNSTTQAQSNLLGYSSPDSSREAKAQSNLIGYSVNQPTAQPTPLTREFLLATLAREVAAHFNLEGDLQLELIRPWTPPARVASNWELSVLEFPTVPSSSLMLRCRVLADGVVATETTFVFRAQLLRDAWVSRQPVAAGGAFDPASLEARRVDLLRERDALPAAVGDRSYIFTRAVPAGRLLTWRDISRRPLVRKGDLVEVAATEGTLIVTMKALAMENGARGDTVTVRNPESRKDFAAMVVDENRVQVRF